MHLAPEKLTEFRQWMRGRGRSDDTAELYISNLRRCAADPDGVTNRLVSGDLAPNTIRTNLAALRAWARFTKDAEFAQQLGDIRLPPARNVRIKLPLGTDDWRKIVRHLHTCPMDSEPMRQVLLIMAIRGFRSGDVLRMKRTEVVRALETGKIAYEGKGRKRIEFAAAPIRDQLEALAKIKGWERVRDLLGTGRSRRGLSRKVWRAAVRTAKGAGIPQMNPHRYRRTFATQFLGRLRGDPNAIIKLQKYMGWESMETAGRYVNQVSQNELDEIGSDLVEGLLRDP